MSLILRNCWSETFLIMAPFDPDGTLYAEVIEIAEKEDDVVQRQKNLQSELTDKICSLTTTIDGLQDDLAASLIELCAQCLNGALEGQERLHTHIEQLLEKESYIRMCLLANSDLQVPKLREEVEEGRVMIESAIDERDRLQKKLDNVIFMGSAATERIEELERQIAIREDEKVRMEDEMLRYVEKERQALMTLEELGKVIQLEMDSRERVESEMNLTRETIKEMEEQLKATKTEQAPLEQARKASKDAQSSLDTARAELRSVQSLLDSCRSVLTQRDDELDRMRQDLQAGMKRVDELQRREKQAKDKIEELEPKIALHPQLQKRVTELEGQLATQRQELLSRDMGRQRATDLDGLLLKVETIEAGRNSLQERVVELTAKIASSEADRDSLGERVAELVGQLDTIQKDRTYVRSLVEKITAELDHYKAERDGFADRITELTTKLEASENDRESLLSRIAELTSLTRVDELETEFKPKYNAQDARDCGMAYAFSPPSSPVSTPLQRTPASRGQNKARLAEAKKAMEELKSHIEWLEQQLTISGAEAEVAMD